MSNFFAEGLPFPAYVLALAYGSMGVTSVVMLVGLRLRKTKLLLSWLLLNVVTFCPEAGMVLFMTIYHWVTHFLKTLCTFPNNTYFPKITVKSSHGLPDLEFLPFGVFSLTGPHPDGRTGLERVANDSLYDS